MRRFSQRSSLVTLSEINITPLLDLAFVLLIIFIITTPLIERGLPVNLPKGSGQPNEKIDQKNVRTVEIDARGAYSMNRHPMQLQALVAQLARDYQYNNDLVIYIRADENSRMKDFVSLADALVQKGIARYSIRTLPPEGR